MVDRLTACAYLSSRADVERAQAGGEAGLAWSARARELNAALASAEVRARVVSQSLCYAGAIRLTL